VEWIVAVVESPVPAAEDGETFHPVALVWYEPETDKVIDIQLTKPGLVDAPALFTRVTEAPKEGPPRTPDRVRVADPVLAAALTGRIGDVEVVVGDISEAREAVQSLAEYMSRMEATLEVDVEAWSRLFRAAAAFYRARPWDTIPGDEWIGVACERLGISEGALTVVGQLGQSHGVALCRTVGDAVQWLAAAQSAEQGEPAPLPSEFYMLGYDDRQDLSEEDLELVTSHGWEVAAPDAYPSLTVLGEDQDARSPTGDELIGMAAILEALVAMVTDEGEWDGEPIEWQGEVGGTRVRLVAPLELPSAPVDPADASLDILGADGQIDEDLFERYRNALMTRLSAREEIPDEVLAPAEMLVEFAAQFHGLTFPRITVDELETLLLETIPSRLAVGAEEAGRIVAGARELMRFVGDELGSVAAPQALVLLDGAFEKELERELANESNYDRGKQLVMAGIAAGFDMSSEDGVADFVRAFAEAQKPEKPKAKAKPKTKAKAKPKATAKAKPKATAKAPKAKATAKAKPAKKPATKRARRR
jgi:hypothetical protein